MHPESGRQGLPRAEYVDELTITTHEIRRAGLEGQDFHAVRIEFPRQSLETKRSGPLLPTEVHGRGDNDHMVGVEIRNDVDRLSPTLGAEVTPVQFRLPSAQMPELFPVGVCRRGVAYDRTEQVARSVDPDSSYALVPPRLQLKWLADHMPSLTRSSDTGRYLMPEILMPSTM